LVSPRKTQEKEKNMLKRLTGHPVRFIAVAAALMAACVAGGSPLRAFAYGTEHLYEVTLSYNCQNTALCASSPFGIGGLWGWLEPDTGGSADGALTFQGHQNADPSLNGVGHSTAFLGYTIINCPGANPLCGLVGVIPTPIDPNGSYFVFFVQFTSKGVPPFVLPVVTPATPGHYALQGAPGVSSNATVTELH
jgi:hypothetical protein